MTHARVWVTVGAASRRLGVGLTTIHRLADEGRITTLRIHGVRARRFKIADIERMLEDNISLAKPQQELVAVSN